MLRRHRLGAWGVVLRWSPHPSTHPLVGPAHRSGFGDAMEAAPLKATCFWDHLFMYMLMDSLPV